MAKKTLTLEEEKNVLVGDYRVLTKKMSDLDEQIADLTEKRTGICLRLKRLINGGDADKSARFDYAGTAYVVTERVLKEGGTVAYMRVAPPGREREA